MTNRTPTQLTADVRRLRTDVYSRPDPAADQTKLEELAQAEQELAAAQGESGPTEREKQTPPPTRRPMLLGPKTTAVRVETKLHMQPLPTGIYHLLDPAVEPLLSVTVQNLDHRPRRVRVSACLEKLSARAVSTRELGPMGLQEATASFPMHPTLLPEQARRVTEVRWATLHVIVDLLGGTMEDQNPIPVLCESHNTFPVLCLARTSGFNAVVRPEDGKVVDLSRYYGAWVTPYVEPVQERVRLAAALSDDKQMSGYQRGGEFVIRQVKALYDSLKDAGLAYVHSVIDYGQAGGQSTQRTRLPRQSLAQKSANCIDGTVLLASLLEGASLNPALVLVPGHAFLAWEKGEEFGEWSYLETTMLGTHDFEAAHASGEAQAATYYKFYRAGMRRHSLAELRRAGIFPME